MLKSNAMTDSDLARPVLFLAGLLVIVLTLVWLPLGLLGLLGFIWLVLVSRPPRPGLASHQPGFVCAPIDGRLLDIRTRENQIIVSFQTGWLASHVWVMPIAAEIDQNLFIDGVFLANDDAASRQLNPRREIEMLAESGARLTLVQWGGPLARYLACPAPEGRKMTVATPAGLTLLHGRIDLVLPAGCKILAQPGMRCLAGETILAEQA